MSDQQILSASDVAHLLQDSNQESRIVAAEKVAATFSKLDLSSSEREIAEDIFRFMVKDAAVRVRQALSESLRDNPDVPHDVALSLAKDVEDVALPVIENSLVLTDDDLISIVETQGLRAQMAVAGRPDVSEDVSNALVETNNEAVVSRLLENEQADISDQTYQTVLNQFGDSDVVKEPLVQRKGLPIAVTERLVTLVSDQLRDHIMNNHNVSFDTASDLLLGSREKATLSLASGTDRSGVMDLVEQLHRNGRLTDALVTRALCMGDMIFFETALAKMTDIPVANAYILIHDKGGLGIKRLFEVAGISDEFLDIARAAMDVAKETSATAGDDAEIYRQLVIERVLTLMGDTFDTSNIDYLIGKLSKRQSAVSA